MTIELTAQGSGYYKVFVDDVQVSQHVAEREAIERASNERTATNTVYYTHEYTVTVEGETTVVEDRYQEGYDNGYTDGFIDGSYTPEPPIPEPSTEITIELNGDNQEIEVGDVYVELGATATGPMGTGVSIEISGTVDTTTEGIYEITYTATDTIGNIATATREVTVVPIFGQLDNIPDAFSFSDKTNQTASSTVTSDPVTITGLQTFAGISVSGGSYDINESDIFRTDTATVNNNDTVRARHTSASGNGESVNTVVTISGVSDTFTSTTSTPSLWDIDQAYTDAFAANSTGSTYYIAGSSGSNGNPGTLSQPWATMSYAASQMSGGDELIIVDGTYTDDLDMLLSSGSFPSGIPPSGPTPAVYTIIRAQTPFGVRFNHSNLTAAGAKQIDTGGGSYKWIDGIIANTTSAGSWQVESTNQIDGTRNRVTRCIMRCEHSALSYQYTHNMDVGGSYPLIQDCGLVGSGRYQIQSSGNPNAVYRRVISRQDYMDGDQPRAVFINYDSDEHHYQNAIVCDMYDTDSGEGTYGYMWGAFYDRDTCQNTSYKGCIAVNCDGSGRGYAGGLGTEKFGATSTTDHCVWWGNQGEGHNDDSGSGNTTNTNITAGDNGTNYSGSNAPTNSRISDTNPANILNNTPGAVIKFAHGAFLSHQGDTNWDTITTDRLWPFPYEDEYRAVFSEAITVNPSGSAPANPDATRGWCDDAVANSLTQYLHEYTDTPMNLDDFYS